MNEEEQQMVRDALQVIEQGMFNVNLGQMAEILKRHQVLAQKLKLYNAQPQQDLKVVNNGNVG